MVTMATTVTMLRMQTLSSALVQENNVRPGSNGRGRGVAQKKQNPNNQQKQNAAPQKQGAAPQQKPASAQKKGDKQGPRKYEPVVNPQKKENVVKKIFNKIFGFKEVI